MTHAVMQILGGEEEDHWETMCGIRMEPEQVTRLPKGTDDVDCPDCIERDTIVDFLPPE